MTDLKETVEKEIDKWLIECSNVTKDSKLYTSIIINVYAKELEHIMFKGNITTLSKNANQLSKFSKHDGFFELIKKLRDDKNYTEIITSLQTLYSSLQLFLRIDTIVSSKYNCKAIDSVDNVKENSEDVDAIDNVKERNEESADCEENWSINGDASSTMTKNTREEIEETICKKESVDCEENWSINGDASSTITKKTREEIEETACKKESTEQIEETIDTSSDEEVDDDQFLSISRIKQNTKQVKKISQHIKPNLNEKLLKNLKEELEINFLNIMNSDSYNIRKKIVFSITTIIDDINIYEKLKLPLKSKDHISPCHVFVISKSMFDKYKEQILNKNDKTTTISNLILNKINLPMGSLCSDEEMCSTTVSRYNELYDIYEEFNSNQLIKYTLEYKNPVHNLSKTSIDEYKNYCSGIDQLFDKHDFKYYTTVYHYILMILGNYISRKFSIYKNNKNHIIDYFYTRDTFVVVAKIL